MNSFSFPLEISNNDPKGDLKQQILAGRYSSGELVVPQKFTKIWIVDGKIEIEEFLVQVRKIILSQIRKNLLEKHNNYLRIQNDQYYKNITQEEVIGELTKMRSMQTILISFLLMICVWSLKSCNGRGIFVYDTMVLVLPIIFKEKLKYQSRIC